MKTNSQAASFAYRVITRLINSKAKSYYSTLYPNDPTTYAAQGLLEDLIGLLEQFKASESMCSLPEVVDAYTTKMQNFNDNFKERKECHYESPAVRLHLLDLGNIVWEACRWHYSESPIIPLDEMLSKLKAAV